MQNIESIMDFLFCFVCNFFAHGHHEAHPREERMASSYRKKSGPGLMSVCSFIILYLRSATPVGIHNPAVSLL